MKFKKLIIKNFLSFTDTEQIINLETNDITLITGFNELSNSSNGSGKSVCGNALIWCLYGKTRSLADNVCNKFTGKKNTKVQVDFVKNNNYYEIIRYRKHTEQGNKLYIFENKKDISYDSNKDTQEKLEKIIGVSCEAFISSMVFDKENFKPFLSSTPIERLSIIENMLLDSETIYIYFDKIKKATKKLEEKIQETLDDVKQKKWSIKNIDETIQQYEDNIKLKIKETKEKIQIFIESKEKYNNIENIKEIKTTIEEKIKLNDELKQLKEKIKLLLGNISSNETFTDRLNKINIDISSIEELIFQIKETPNECPTCHQKVNQEITLNEINIKENLLKELKEEKEQIKINLKEKEDKNSIVKMQLNDLYSKEKELMNKIKGLKEYNFTIEELDNITDKLKKIDLNIEEEKNKIKNLYEKDFIETKNNEREMINKKLSISLKKLEKLEEEKPYLNYFYDLFSNKSIGFKKYLINKILPILNEKINYYLSIYFPYEVIIKFDQSLCEEIMVETEQYDFKEFSSGEKMRIEISCIFALFSIINSYLGESSNLIILDEILDLNLDPAGIKSTIFILNKLKEKGNSIFLISHKSDYNDYFDKKIKIIKEKNKKSRIEYE